MNTSNDDMYDCLTSIGLPNGWGNEIQLDNFNRALRIVEYTSNQLRESVENISFLDVGCGTGDFFKFLKEKEIRSDYLGIDIYEPSIDKSKKRFSEEEEDNEEEIFKLENILDWTEDKKFTVRFDYSIASGSLSTYTNDNYNFLKQMVTKMWGHSSKGVYFNIMANDDGSEGIEQEWLFHYSIDKVKKICEDIVGKNGTVIVDLVKHNSQNNSSKESNYSHVHFYLTRKI